MSSEARNTLDFDNVTYVYDDVTYVYDDVTVGAAGNVLGGAQHARIR